MVNKRFFYYEHQLTVCAASFLRSILSSRSVFFSALIAKQAKQATECAGSPPTFHLRQRSNKTVQY